MEYRILNGELYHYNIKGAKWGVRRYQNKDGTLTELGKKRYAKETAGMKESKKKNHVADPDKWVSEDIGNVRGVVDATGNLTKDLQKLNDKIGSKKKAPDVDLSNMSDKEMRDAINRKLLEKQYKDVVVPQKVSRGKECVDEVLSYTGIGLGIAASALTIALQIRKLQGKG